jgi:hypothetical protein
LYGVGLGETVVVVLVLLFVIEVFLFPLAMGMKRALGPYKTFKEVQSSREEGTRYTDYALALSGLTLAIIGIIYGFGSENIAAVGGAIIVLTLSLVFYIVTVSVNDIVLHTRAYARIQDKSMAYGTISMMSGVAVLFHDTSLKAEWIAVTGLVVVLVIHFATAFYEVKSWAHRDGPPQ